MKRTKTKFEQLIIFEPDVFNDTRGYFLESFKDKTFNDLIGYDVDFCQDNLVKSNRNVLRGLHFQNEPYSQAKLISVISGSILDVVVDLRKDSLTYSQFFSLHLNDKNKKMLFIPRGFAHGYLSLEDNTIISYKVDNYYNPKHENGISYRDKHLNIDWGIDLKNIITSEKDEVYPNYDW